MSEDPIQMEGLSNKQLRRMKAAGIWAQLDLTPDEVLMLDKIVIWFRHFAGAKPLGSDRHFSNIKQEWTKMEDGPLMVLGDKLLAVSNAMRIRVGKPTTQTTNLP